MFQPAGVGGDTGPWQDASAFAGSEGDLTSGHQALAAAPRTQEL